MLVKVFFVTPENIPLCAVPSFDFKLHGIQLIPAWASRLQLIPLGQQVRRDHMSRVHGITRERKQATPKTVVEKP